ncbi:hypothetical protein ACP26L_35665 [Paenibacillus sp. S-38]|uniref:hypothetical protein n=1 Tax=Paenibacillus sp. S-38 TaxID=3416710 RepID=UPI003CF6C9C1
MWALLLLVPPMADREASASSGEAGAWTKTKAQEMAETLIEGYGILTTLIFTIFT